MTRIVIHLKENTKPIVLTDNNDNIKEKCLSLLKNNNITIFETEKDTIIIRPSEIQAIHLNEIKDQKETS